MWEQVNQLAKNLAMEWSGRGIRVNVRFVSIPVPLVPVNRIAKYHTQSVSPGYVRTALTAALLDAQPELDEIWHRKKLLNRLATPDEMRGQSSFPLEESGRLIIVKRPHCVSPQ